MSNLNGKTMFWRRNKGVDSRGITGYEMRPLSIPVPPIKEYETLLELLVEAEYLSNHADGQTELDQLNVLKLAIERRCNEIKNKV